MQAHRIWEVSALYCTVQSRCVQTAVNARNSLSGVRTKIAGLVPNGKTMPEFAGT